MPDLNFHIENAEPVLFAAAPTLAMKLRIENAVPAEPVHSVLLRCQVQIAATRRRYSREEQERLYELFGEPAQWAQSLRTLLWTHVQANVPGFTGGTRIDLLLPCTFDFNVSATKYFAGLEDGEIPLELLFSGPVFYAAEHGGLQVMQIPWEKEVNYCLPVRVWREMMDHYYPNSVWVRLPRDVFDRLHRYKSRRAIPTWEQALERLLDQGSAPPAAVQE
jgi:hypothetical protein